MWENLTKVGGTTNTITLPTDGIVSIVIPAGVELCAYVNGVAAPMHHIHVKANDTLYFQLDSHSAVPANVEIQYNGTTQNLAVVPDAIPSAMTLVPMEAVMANETVVPAIDIAVEKSNEDKKMNVNPNDMVNLFTNPNQMGGSGGAMGAGLGAGLLGGVLGGALLGNNGGILGNRNNGVGVEGLVTPTLLANEVNRIQDNTQFAIAANERLTQSRFDAEAQREIQAAVERTASATQLAAAIQAAALGVEIAKGQGEVNTQVALTSGATQTQAALNAAALGVQVQKNVGELGTQVALQSSALGVQIQKTAGDIQVQNALTASQSQIAIKELATANSLAFKDVQIQALTTSNVIQAQAAQNKYELATAVKFEGDETRALINKLNDDTLNRLLVTAQNQIIELRGDRNHEHHQRESEVRINQTVTTNQNQIQAQQQQQQQLSILGQIAASLNNLQIATATNQQLIIGNTGAVAGGPQTANPVNVRA